MLQVQVMIVIFMESVILGPFNFYFLLMDFNLLYFFMRTHFLLPLVIIFTVSFFRCFLFILFIIFGFLYLRSSFLINKILKLVFLKRIWFNKHIRWVESWAALLPNRRLRLVIIILGNLLWFSYCSRQTPSYFWNLIFNYYFLNVFKIFSNQIFWRILLSFEKFGRRNIFTFHWWWSFLDGV